LTIALLPALEQSSKMCLTERIFNRKLCNIGEVVCTEINLIDNTVNCSVCVDGMLVPVTDDGSLNYCAHFVSLQKAHLNITIDDKNKGLKFTTLNGNITGNIAIKSTHRGEDGNGKEVRCSWVMFSYSNISGDSKLVNLNNLLHCDAKDNWLCLETASYHNQYTEPSGNCYKSIANCVIQRDNGIPMCSPSLGSNVQVKVNTSCTSREHVLGHQNGFDKCVFTWEFNKEDLIYDKTNFALNFNWNNDSETKIKDFKCFKGNTLVCSNSVSTCTGTREYHYNFSDCTFTTNPVSTTHYNAISAASQNTIDASTKWLITVIVILVLLFVSYVGYKNYQKVSSVCEFYVRVVIQLPKFIHFIHTSNYIVYWE